MAWKTKSTHGHTKNGKYTKEYRTWDRIIQRCTNPKYIVYSQYGGKGITVCEKWLNSFEEFYADMGNKPSNRHSIDRIDGTGNYEPSNCRWATPTEQIINQKIRSDNKTGYKGVSWDKRDKRYIAQIKFEGKHEVVTYINTLEEAVSIRKQLELKYWGEPS